MFFFFVIDYSPISYQQFMPVRKQFKITFAERGRNFSSVKPNFDPQVGFVEVCEKGDL